jgi:hypothetical protein
MKNGSHGPVLYIDEKRTSQKAVKMLKGAGFAVDVRIAPTDYRAAYGVPVLFALFNRFEGLEGIRIFLKNAARP